MFYQPARGTGGWRYEANAKAFLFRSASFVLNREEIVPFVDKEGEEEIKTEPKRNPFSQLPFKR
jgi:hypothetical protein